MTPEELAAIRERDAEITPIQPWDIDQMELDRRALLAHIDAVSEAVKGLPGAIIPYGDSYIGDPLFVDRAAVLALLGAR